MLAATVVINGHMQLQIGAYISFEHRKFGPVQGILTVTLMFGIFVDSVQLSIECLQFYLQIKVTLIL